jgi:hypothetical protein
MVQAWHFLGSTPLRRLGKLTLREDAWRLPSGDERRYPVLHVGTTVGIVPFVDAETAYCYVGEQLVADPLASDDDEFFERRVVPFHEAVAMALDDRITESVSKVALLAVAVKRGVGP